jgi:hypothetical protein
MRRGGKLSLSQYSGIRSELLDEPDILFPSVFVLRYNYYDLATELGVQHIFPIVDDFSITMAQVSRGSVDTRTSLLDMPRSGTYFFIQ